MVTAQLVVDVAVCVAPRQVLQWRLELPAGATLGQGVEAALRHLQAQHPDVAIDPQWQWGIWGRSVADDQVLQPGDRLEAYRALQVDPKVARRERFARQGARGAGLFAKRRKDGKPGY